MDGKNVSNHSSVPASSSGASWPKSINSATRANIGKSQSSLSVPGRFPSPGIVRLGRGNTDYSPPPLQSHPGSAGYPINQPPGIIASALISNSSSMMNMHPHQGGGAGNSSVQSSYSNQISRGQQQQQQQQPPMPSMNLGPDSGVPPPNSYVPPPTIAYPLPTRTQYASQPPPGLINSNTNVGPNQNQSHMGNQPAQLQQGSEGNKMRVFTGTVKKMHGNFGFVDDDVFFQLNTVKGPPPKSGDRVLVEAAYNANMPFKWNASRVQVLPHVSSNDGGGQMQQQMQRQHQPNVGDKGRDADRERNRGRRDRERDRPKQDAGDDSSRANGSERAPGRTRGPSRESQRDRSPTSASRTTGKGEEPTRRRSRSPRPTTVVDSNESSNARHRSRSPRRNYHGHHSSLDEPISPPYRVAIPKISTATEEAGVMTLRSRYPNLYIPSDFFSAQFSWSSAFDTQGQFPLMRKRAPVKIHVFPKDVETLDADGEGPRGSVNADDCSHEYSAKVMLPSWPSFREICDQTLGGLGSSKPSPAPTSEPRHPTRCLEFLVGTKNRNEIGAIGGPWSPSLDGENPAENPHVLINTAVRTFKSLTGIDLDGCNTWYKFVELHYFRSEEDYKGKITPAHAETVVIFIPDIWGIQLDLAKWKKSAAAYEVIGQRKLQELAEAAPVSAAEAEAEVAVVETTPVDAAGDQLQHWSELDPKNMKIDDLRMQLKLRKLSDAGLKSNLIARMHKAIKAEQEADDLAGEMEDREANTVTTSDSKPKGKSSRVTRYGREKANLEKIFFLPEDTPKLVVHPCKTAKGGKFDCAVMSLSVLLDYRQEDQKESSFEVGLFAELFNEMLLRDFGLKIYRTMSTMTKTNPVPDKTKVIVGEADVVAKGGGATIASVPTSIPPFDPFLLVAFVYFDLNRTGYILEKDLGEILETLGLSLSRNQIKNVISGFAGQDGQKIYYENLCEKYDGSIIMEGQEFLEDDDEEEEEWDDSLGNMHLVRCIKEKSVEGLEGTSLPNGNKGKKRKDASSDSSETSMVFFRGSMIDLDKLHQQLAESESTTRHIKESIVESEAEIERVKSRKMQLEKNALKDGTEIETLQATLNQATDNLRMQKGKMMAFSNVLQCQRDALAKGVEIIRKTLDKYASEQDDSALSV